MSGIGFKLDPLWRVPDHLVQDADLTDASGAIAHQLNLEFVSTLECGSGIGQPFVAAHCHEVISMDHG